MAIQRNIEWEEGWSVILKAVTKVIRILEGEPEPVFETEQHMTVYSTTYVMCSQRADYSEELYDRYCLIIEDYLKQKVLPSLREKHFEHFLRELVKSWDNHKYMVKWLYKFFNYLDKYYCRRKHLPTLSVTGLTYFHDLVYSEVHCKATKAVLALIHEEREGKVIDKALLKSVLNVYVENGMGSMEKYQEDFESLMLKDTATYYFRKASRWLWIQEDSCPAYMLKSEESLKNERERVTYYLHSSTEPKLVEKVQNELLVVVAKPLLENEHSGCCALLRDDKMDDLSRIYRLYCPITQGLGLVADLFKKHITAEGNALIEQVHDTSVNQVLIEKVIELPKKYMVYVTECFHNHTLFHKALKEAYEIICNKTVAGISSVALLETLCDISLKKGGKNSYEA